MTGPTGAPADHSRRRKAKSSWSVPSAERGPGIAILNEASSHGHRYLVCENMAAIFVHVDDHVILGHSPSTRDTLLDLIVKSLVDIGFSVSE